MAAPLILPRHACPVSAKTTPIFAMGGVDTIYGHV